MRAAFIDQTGDKAGGAEESLALLLRFLPPEIAPTVIVFEDGEYAERLRAGGLPVIVFAIPGALATTTREHAGGGGMLQLPGAIRRMAALLRASAFDVVHTNTVKAHLIGAPAARLAGIPCVMHLRDALTGTGRLALRSVARLGAHERIAIASTVADAYALPRTTVIENPVDLVRYEQLPDRRATRARLGLPLEGVVIGIVGRINRWKGQDVFLRAVAHAAQRVAVHCAIVGEPRFRDADFVPELHALAADLGLQDATTFVPWDDPAAIFAALDVHVNASQREPFGRTVIEAAAAGVPSICFADAGVVEFVERGVTTLVVPAGDHIALGDAIARFAADAPARGAAGRASRLWSHRFAAPRPARRVADILERVAG